MKNSRDKVYLMTDKRNSKGDVIPECEHGYWGGFSPKRKGKYENKELSKMYTNGRARLYPSARRLQGSLKKAGETPKRDRLESSIKVDSLDLLGGSQEGDAANNFRVITTHEKANDELDRMRNENNHQHIGTSENLLTENNTVSAVEKASN